MVDELELIREGNGWTQGQMAAELGCVRTLYTETLRGRAIGLTLGRCVARRFPRLRDAVVELLLG